MFSRIPNLQIYNFLLLFSFKTWQDSSIEIKNVQVLLLNFTKKHFAAPLKENNIFFMKKNRKSGIRENMSQTGENITKYVSIWWEQKKSYLWIKKKS